MSGVNGEKALLDFVFVQQEMRGRLLDVNVLRGRGEGYQIITWLNQN